MKTHQQTASTTTNVRHSRRGCYEAADVVSFIPPMARRTAVKRWLEATKKATSQAPTFEEAQYLYLIDVEQETLAKNSQCMKGVFQDYFQ